MGESHEDYAARRLREWTPFPDGLGLRGPAPEIIPLREIQGATGGQGSYQVDDLPFARNYGVDPEPGGATDGSGTIPKVILVLNGTAYYTTLTGKVGAAV